MASTAATFLLTSPIGISIAKAQTPAPQSGQAAPAGQPGQAGQPAQGGAAKNWKDRAEYDLYVQMSQAKEPQQRLQLLNTWQDKYPTTDYSKERLQAFVATYGQLAPTDPSAGPKLIDYSKQLLKVDPQNFTANYYITLVGPRVGGANPQPDLLTDVDTAAHAVISGADANFPAAKKPANMSDADWTKAKNQVVALSHNSLAWAAVSKKDPAAAGNEYKASLEANPENGTIPYEYARLLQNDKKYPEALFEYARAAQYDGPNAIPADKRPSILAYYNKIYQQFHGNMDGADKLLAQAKTTALPPTDLKIEDASKAEADKADAMNKRLDSDPQFKLWYQVKQSLTADQGQSFFDSNVKGVEIPGTSVAGVKDFSGTVISLDPPDKPTKIMLAVEDPTKADATIMFDQPIPADAVKVGDKLEFSGQGNAFVKDPYMLTLDNPDLPSVKMVKKTPRRGRAAGSKKK